MPPTQCMASNSETAKNAFRNYSKRFFIHPLTQNVELPEAEAYVVIPCYAEEELLKTLESLRTCDSPKSRFCILVVVNDKLTDHVDLKLISDQNIKACENFRTQTLPFNFVWIDARNQNDKNAGVGLARKIGMDAVILNCQTNGQNPALICLDADSLVSKDYFLKIESEFLNHNADVAVFEFDHNRSNDLEPKLQSGILQYELFLEYYRLGLKFAAYPFSFHTVGSSMACKAVAYAQHGGMNQRKAGEDFYFLHKLFPHFETIEIEGPMVFPSARISNRVPFGTGRFQEKWVGSHAIVYETYHPEVFSILKIFLKQSLYLLENQDQTFESTFSTFESAHRLAASFLSTFNVEQNMLKILKSSPKIEKRRKAYFQWFDGLLVLKLVHFFNTDFPNVPVSSAIKILAPVLSEFSSDFELKFALRNYMKALPSKATL